MIKEELDELNGLIKIKQAPKYLVKRVVVYKKYNPVGILVGESRYYQIFALVDDYNEANKICSKLNNEVNKDELPYDMEIRYEVGGNLKNNWHGYFEVNGRKEEW